MNRIYVAGPYSGNREERHINTYTAIDVGIVLLQKGWFPFIPHLSHFVDEEAQNFGVKIPYRHYMAWDDAFLQICDAFIHVWHSPGADEELQRAKELGLVIYYDLDSVPDISTTPANKRMSTLSLDRVYERWRENPRGLPVAGYNPNGVHTHVYNPTGDPWLLLDDTYKRIREDGARAHDQIELAEDA